MFAVWRNMLTFAAENERLINHLSLARFRLFFLLSKAFCTSGCSFLNLANVSLDTWKCRQMSATDLSSFSILTTCARLSANMFRLV